VIERHEVPASGLRGVRYWDLAATEPSAANRDPDWTVGLRLDWHRESGDYFLIDIVRERRGPGAIEELVKTTAERDGREVSIVIEQEPGAAGVQALDRYKRHVLAGYSVRAKRPTGDKLTRATPVAATAENGLLRIVRGRHLPAFLDEISGFPHGRHDDCVDALAGAHEAVTLYGGYATISVPRGQIYFDPLASTRSLAERRYPRDIEGERIADMLGVPLCPAPPPGLRLRAVRRR
jgi:predicted phage terminase large subunit-like protein